MAWLVYLHGGKLVLHPKVTVDADIWIEITWQRDSE